VAAAALGACGLALGPWLTFQARVLLGQPHYAFVPLVPLGVAVLLARDCRGLGSLVPGSRLVSVALLLVSAALLALADLFYSALFGSLAALVVWLAIAQGLGGLVLLRATLPAWAFLWVTIRPPLGLDTELVYRLQDVATAWSSAVLDLLRVRHLPAGHLLEIPGRTLFIEEACGGVQSLFVVLAATWFFVLWARRPWARAALVLAAAAVWALLGNVARIVTVAVAAASGGPDLAAGWRHEALAFAILAVVLGLVASSDQLAGLVLEPAARRWVRLRYWYFEWRYMAALRRRAIQGEDLEVASREVTDSIARPPLAGHAGPTRLPVPGATWLGCWPLVALIALVGLAQVAIVGRAISLSYPRLERRFEGLTADFLPERMGTLRRVSFDASEESARGTHAGNARVWTYEGANLQAHVAVFYPYVGWHETTYCFRGTGWTVERRQVEPDGEVVVAWLSQAAERHALAWFMFLDAGDHALKAPGKRDRGDFLRERLGEALSRIAPRLIDLKEFEQFGPSYQIQVILERRTPPEPGDEALGRALFDEARAVFRRAGERGLPHVDRAP
jgi:exosortase